MIIIKKSEIVLDQIGGRKKPKYFRKIGGSVMLTTAFLTGSIGQFCEHTI